MSMLRTDKAGQQSTRLPPTAAMTCFRRSSPWEHRQQPPRPRQYHFHPIFVDAATAPMQPQHPPLSLLTTSLQPNQRNKYGRTSLHAASYYGHVDVVGSLIEVAPDENCCA